VSVPTNALYKLKISFFKDKIVEYGIYHSGELNGLGYTIEG
jgi:hypothetical protein